MQGHIHKRVRATKDGRQATSWYVVVDLTRGPDGRRRQKWHGGFRTRKEAEAVKAKLANEMHSGLYVEPTKVTLGEWVESSWLPTMRSQVKASTWDSYMRNLRLHVLPALGHRTLQQLTPLVLNGLYAELMESGKQTRAGGGLAPKTVRYVHATLHKVLADAVDAGILQNNPAGRARPPKPKVSGPREMQVWDADQLAKFLAHIGGHHLGAAFHLAAMTGMRRGEVLGLRWHDIDLGARRLAVRHTFVSVAYEIRDSTPKTHQARVVDLDPVTIDHLRHHLTRQEAQGEKWGPGYLESDLVFRREDGSPVHPDSFTQAFDAAVRRSGLPRIRLHDLRHTHATIALRAGVPVKVISERLGHENPAFTMKQYAHVLPGMQAEAAALIAALVTGAGAQR
jgi:integrase